MSSLPAGELFRDGVIVGHEPNGSYHHSGSYRDYGRKDSVKLLPPVVEVLKEHHGMNLRVDHGSYKVISLFYSRTMSIKAARLGLVLRVDNNSADLSVGGKGKMLNTGDWAYIPPGVTCTLRGTTHGHTCMGVVSKVRVAG